MYLSLEVLNLIEWHFDYFPESKKENIGNTHYFFF